MMVYRQAQPQIIEMSSILSLEYSASHLNIHNWFKPKGNFCTQPFSIPLCLIKIEKEKKAVLLDFLLYLLVSNILSIKHALMNFKFHIKDFKNKLQENFEK